MQFLLLFLFLFSTGAALADPKPGDPFYEDKQDWNRDPYKWSDYDSERDRRKNLRKDMRREKSIEELQREEDIPHRGPMPKDERR